MGPDFSNQNLQNKSFRGQNISNANFRGSDLRGADFTNSIINNADFTNVKTGIPNSKIALIFFVALLVSMASGYVAMLAGKGIQQMIESGKKNVVNSGFLLMGIMIVFMIFSAWRGVARAIYLIFIPSAILAIIIGITAIASGKGTGSGAFYLILALFVVSFMFIIGTLARAAAGTISNILFTLVAISGGLFSKTLGGGIGTAIMALSCVIISKRALAGAKGFEVLKNMGLFITSKYGTSFRNAQLANSNFKGAKIHNADFTDADTSNVTWGDTKMIHTILINHEIVQEEKAGG